MSANLQKTSRPKYSSGLLALACSALLTACGGGGGGGGESGSTGSSDTTGPEVALTSPSQNNATTSKTIEVAGTASDSGSTIVSVTVNGVSAQSDNGFADWTAIVPVGTGLTSFTVVAEDSSSNETSLVSNIQTRKLNEVFSSVSDLVINANESELVINDADGQQVYKLALASADLSPINLTDGGLAASLTLPREAAGSLTLNDALIIDTNTNDRGQSEIIRQFDTDTGEISQVLDLSSVAGLARVIDIAPAPTGSLIYLLSEIDGSRNGGAIWVHNTADSSTTLLTQTEISGNADFSIPNQLAYGNASNSLYYLDNDALVQFSIDDASLSTLSARDGDTPIIKASDLFVDEVNNRAWVTDSAAKLVLEINLASGERRILSQNVAGSGPDYNNPAQLAYDSLNDRLLVADSELKIIFSVSPEDGRKEYFVSSLFGTGPALSDPVDVAIDDVAEFAYVTDQDLNAVFKINLDTGDRSLLSLGSDDPSAEVGAGISLSAPRSIALSSAANEAWVTDSELGSIVSIDLVSGNRSSLDLSYDAGASNLQKPVAIDFDVTSGNIVVSGLFGDNVQSIDSSDLVSLLASGALNDGNRIQKLTALESALPIDRVYGIDDLIKGVVEWNLAGNTGRVLSRVFVGSGENFSKPYDLQVTSDGSRIFVSDSNLKAIIEVDPSSGNRVILSDRDTGTGPNFSMPAGMSIDEANDRLIVVDRDDKALFEVSMTTGDRTILSR